MSAALSAPGAVAAAPATGGLSLLLPLLMSFGPGILSKLFGGQNPNQKLREQLLALLNPQQQRYLTDQNYNAILNSPAYSQGQGVIATGANNTANTVASNMAQRGLGGSGTRDVLSGLTPSLVGSQLAGLHTAAYGQAQNQTLEDLKSQIAALTGTSGPSQPQQLFATGLEGFTPYLTQYLKAKYPTIFPAAAK